MAGDWIKLETVTPDKPEVIGIAHHLGIDQDAVTGKLCRLWIWADQQTTDGNASVTLAALPKTFIDRITCVSGFADAMLAVGWLVEVDGGFVFPNFDRHNGETAKQRALTNKRVAAHRKKMKRKCNGDSVTSALPKALPEKRREENNINTPIVPSFPPTVAEVSAYVATRPIKIDAERFVDYYQARGWKLKSGRMKDWRAAVRTWEKNAADRKASEPAEEPKHYLN